MAFYDLLKNAEKEIIKCMKCGNCQAVCPIYKETLGEPGVARGKIQLARALLNGELQYTDKLDELFSLCLTCKACAASCPCGVQPDKIILAARAAMVQSKGLPPVKRNIFRIIKKPGSFRLTLHAGRKLQALGLKRIKGKNLAAPRLPIGLDMRRVVPPLAEKPLLDKLPRVNSVDRPKFKVAFFTGCINNYVYTDSGQSVVEVLNANNIEVILPKDQHCCGIPTFMNGDLQATKEIARYNISVLESEDVDAIITACGTCGEALSRYYPEILEDDSDFAHKARQIAAKVYDVSQFLVEKAGLRRPQATLNLRVTYHDPCHLARGMNVSTQPREIIKSIPGVELVEMQNPDRCCGNAGSFSLTHYEMSRRIGDKKINDILSVKPDAVISGCGACRMQIEEGLYRNNAEIPVLHFAQLLAKAYLCEIS